MKGQDSVLLNLIPEIENNDLQRMKNVYRLAGDIQKAAEAEQKGKNFLLVNNKH